MIRTDCQSCLQRVLFPCDSVKRLEFQSQIFKFVSQTREDYVCKTKNGHSRHIRILLVGNPAAGISRLAITTACARRALNTPWPWWAGLNLKETPSCHNHLTGLTIHPVESPGEIVKLPDEQSTSVRPGGCSSGCSRVFCLGLETVI